MSIGQLPREVLSEILLLAAKANEAEGETFTYGLARVQTSPHDDEGKLTKYVRGPLSAECLRWDGSYAIRQVCSRWHEWALSYNFEHVLERKWRGNQVWANLAINRRNYRLYELNSSTGLAYLRVDPFGSLRKTDQFFADFPSAAQHIRRLWFNGFHVEETDRLVLSIIARCTNLVNLSAPWTIVRRGSAEDWVKILKVGEENSTPLRSLELTAVCLSQMSLEKLNHNHAANPLEDARVDFSELKRLKLFGNTLQSPICDQDLELIAKTAMNLECLDLTNLSTISVAGMLALVRASKDTLRVLEHSPRSDDGFFHPFPGAINEHICELIADIPEMRDLSMSVPYICADLFARRGVKWEGECQVRTTSICGCDAGSDTQSLIQQLRTMFKSARGLIADRRRVHRELSIEIFFAGCIFEPGKRLVHGDFALPEISSDGQWPSHKQNSTKGPYGQSGTYGKDEGAWNAISEDDYLLAMANGWITNS